MTAIAHYNLLERLGEGAFSEIYRARDTKVGRTVALRLIRDEAFDNREMRTAFLDDARAAARLSHPNITTLFDVGEYEGGSYLAYEFASGISLRRECDGRHVDGDREARSLCGVSQRAPMVSCRRRHQRRDILARLFDECEDRIECAAKFVGEGWLKRFELEEDLAT